MGDSRKKKQTIFFLLHIQRRSFICFGMNARTSFRSIEWHIYRQLSKRKHKRKTMAIKIFNQVNWFVFLGDFFFTVRIQKIDSNYLRLHVK